MVTNYKVLLVLGKNWDQKLYKKSKKIVLSTNSKASARAASLIAQPYKYVIFSTGATIPKVKVTEASRMFDYFRIYNTAYPEYKIILEERSFDTAGNMEETEKILSSLDTRHMVDVLTVGFHLDRSMTLAKLYGLPVDRAIASEEVLQENGVHDFDRHFCLHMKLKDKLRTMSFWNLVREYLYVEPVARFLLLFDRYGKGITRKLTANIRTDA